MSVEVKAPVLIYTEQTPNPETLKFVTNRMLHKGTADFKSAELADAWSPLASSLFQRSEVIGVYIANNYVTITKIEAKDWHEIMPSLKDFIKVYLQDDKEIVKEGFAEAMSAMDAERRANHAYSEEDEQIVAKIKELIETYVKPAVEMDGGNIEFRRYDAGKVYVIMQGACSGCPSSTVTLKAGIESMLKRMVPQVEEVVAEMG
jgi:Fe-S cluster biogenesis protein NfuA